MEASERTAAPSQGAATAAEKEEQRGSIAREFSEQRKSIEDQFTEDRVAQQEKYHQDLAAVEEAKRRAFLDAGLNSDGSDPQGRPQG